MAKNNSDFLELRTFLSQESDPQLKEQKLRELFAAELLIVSGMNIEKAIKLSRSECGEALMGEDPRAWMNAFGRTIERLNAFRNHLEKN